MGVRQGIVIASQIQKKNKIVVLDQEYGKIVCFPDRLDISHGMLLNYFIRRDTHAQFLYASELIATPAALAARDLLFFQHVMELCYYFLPIACPAPQIFDLLQFLYAPASARLTGYYQKLFLCKFFLLVGLYPEEMAHDPVRISQLAFCAIDRTVTHHVDLGFKEAELDAWLLSCVLAHPYSAQFKTVHFLTTGRSV